MEKEKKKKKEKKTFRIERILRLIKPWISDFIELYSNAYPNCTAASTATVAAASFRTYYIHYVNEGKTLHTHSRYVLFFLSFSLALAAHSVV